MSELRLSEGPVTKLLYVRGSPQNTGAPEGKLVPVTKLLDVTESPRNTGAPEGKKFMSRCC